jgi:enoyl-CoA hydratase
LSRDHQPSHTVRPVASIVREDHGNVAVLRFNRPAVRNALTVEMRGRFARELAEIDKDPAIIAVAICGDGDTFCAGVDMKEARERASGEIFRPHPGEALRGLSKPSVAAIHGACVTGGLEIGLNASLIIASDCARFRDTHAALGLFPAWGMLSLLTETIGVRRARQMVACGDWIDASTALQWGLANELVPRSELLARAVSVARSLGSAEAQTAFLANQNTALFLSLASEEEARILWRGREKMKSKAV